MYLQNISVNGMNYVKERSKIKMEVDARGLSCPIPVIHTEKTIKSNPEKEISVLLDDETAKENVSRLAVKRGYKVDVKKERDGYRLILSP